MPNVDFTLEDLKPVIKSIVDTAIQQHFLAIYDRFDRLENRFDILEGRFDVLESRFDRFEGEFKTTNRLIRKHSADIMELQTRPA